MELLGAAAAILRKPAIGEIKETERNVGVEGSTCFPPPVAHLEKEWASSARCRMNPSDRLNIEGILE